MRAIIKIGVDLFTASHGFLYPASEAISKALEERGLSQLAIEKIKHENMFAKYAAPRLLMGSRVLVSDDDVIWAGPAKEMLECQSTFFFLEDLPGFYGPQSMKLLRSKELVGENASAPPYLCAGLYLMNKGPIRDPKIISEIIEKAESHRDEQSAVGMETRMNGVTYKIGRYPDYHHGAYGPQPIPERSNAMHLQGCLMTLRDHPGFQLQFMSQAVESHANARKHVPETREAYAVFIPILPSHAEMLEMNLDRAQQCGALRNAASVLVVEDEPDEKLRTMRVREICSKFGVVHRFAEQRIGVYTLQQSQQVARYLRDTAELAPDIGWAIRCDVDVLLDGDIWHFLVRRAIVLDLDICANIRPDFRFDSRGYMIIPCAAFSRKATNQIWQAVNDERTWNKMALCLVGVDDVDLTLIARALGLALGSPNGLIGYQNVRDIATIDDLIATKLDSSATPLAYHFRSKTAEGKISVMRECLNQIDRNPGGKNIAVWHRLSHKLKPAIDSYRDVDISILVCCRNFLKRLSVFAKSILYQDWPLARVEVIVANPDSPDGLGEYLRSIGKECLKRFGTRVFYEEKVEAKHGRNRGLMVQRCFLRSSGRIVIGMDCDLVLPVSFLREAYVQTLMNPNAVVGVYRNFLSDATTDRILRGEINPIEKFKELLHEDNNEEQGYRGVLGYCQSAVRAIWETIGYPTEFDEIAKSDVTFMESAGRLGVRPLFLRNLHVLHLHHPRNWMGTEERL
ncbi:MAG TPA: glycosyltransferase family A protein [Planctomycetota bacterium]|nr:glycosyltransferase family A protein [Planctomycetota bacterium]